jgi:uncharacterized membrane protein
MTICTKCGAIVPEGGAFCGSCGTPAAAQVAATAIPATAPAAPAGSAAAAPVSTGLSMNLAAALAYSLGLITGILFLVVEPWKTNRFVRFHAMQSILFSVACIVISIVWTIAVGILVSFTGFWILTIDVPLRLLFGLGIFLLWLYLMFQAYSQREFRLPWIGEIAAKQQG